MFWRKRGLAAALLGVVLIGISGCARSGSLYTAGLTPQTETAADATEPVTEPVFQLTEPETEAILGYVYVCGAVKAPGVYPIRSNMRVCDAIALAGGFSSDADEEWLNQAAVVSDGQKLYVYSREETDQMKASGDTDAASDGSASADGSMSAGDDSSEVSGGKVNLNTATAEELMTLPGIGESKAAAILAYRSEHGLFASIEEIQNISGIKSGVFSKIRDLITV